jgi:hypothetical protein
VFNPNHLFKPQTYYRVSLYRYFLVDQYETTGPLQIINSFNFHDHILFIK